MKLKNIFMLCGGLLLSGALLTSCSDDDSYDVVGSKDNLAYFEAAAKTPYQSTITITPAGAVGGVGNVMTVYFQRPVGKDTRVSVKSDPAAAQKYLDENNLDYTLIPENLFDYSLATATVKSGQSASEDGLMVKIDNSKISQLDDPEVAHWFAAFSIDEVVGDGKSSTSRNTFYALVNTDIQEALHVVNGDVSNFGVVFTPVGNFGGVDLDQPYTFSGALNNGATITLTKDNSLISQYNETYGAEAIALPDGLLDITNATVTVDAGKAESNENFKMSLPESKYEQLTVGNTYVVPFKIGVTREDGTTVDNAGVYYLVIATSQSLIKEGAGPDDMIGSPIASSEMENWTCEQGDISSVINTNDWDTWSYNKTYIIDMKEVKKVSGLKLNAMYAQYGSYYALNTVSLDLSEDGENWTECGSTTNLPVSGGAQYYAMYGGVNARYLRLYINGSYRWGGLDALAVYAQ